MSKLNCSMNARVAPSCEKCKGETFVDERESVCAACTAFAPAGPVKARSGTPDRHAALVERAQAGDREALNDLVKDLTPLVYRIANNYARRCRADADDLAQLGLLRVAGALKHYRLDGPAKFSTYAGACAGRAISREATRVIEKRTKRPVLSLDAIEEAADRAPALPARERAAVERALSGLTFFQRYLVEAVAGTHPETNGRATVERRMVGGKGAVAGIYQKALEQLREELAPLA